MRQRLTMTEPAITDPYRVKPGDTLSSIARRCGKTVRELQTRARKRGQTIADFRGQWGQPPNVRVCLEVDAERELAFYLERVTAYRPGTARP